MKKNRIRNAEDILDSAVDMDQMILEAVDMDQMILLEAGLLLQGPPSVNAELRKSLHRIEDWAIKSADLLRNIQG
jgi:hypothetical protein